jgi:hypothetical protein
MGFVNIWIPGSITVLTAKTDSQLAPKRRRVQSILSRPPGPTLTTYDL